MTTLLRGSYDTLEHILYENKLAVCVYNTNELQGVGSVWKPCSIHSTAKSSVSNIQTHWEKRKIKLGKWQHCWREAKTLEYSLYEYKPAVGVYNANELQGVGRVWKPYSDSRITSLWNTAYKDRENSNSARYQWKAGIPYVVKVQRNERRVWSAEIGSALCSSNKRSCPHCSDVKWSSGGGGFSRGVGKKPPLEVFPLEA